MAINSYADLTSAVGSYLARSDLAGFVPDWIKAAEARIHYGGQAPLESEPLRIRQMEQSTAITASSAITLPGDLLEIRDVFMNNNTRTPVELSTPYAIRRRYAGTETGTPLYYSIEGDTMMFGPAPDTTETVTIKYYAKMAAVSAGTPWLLTNHPTLYIYGALLEAAPFLRKDGRLQVWHGLFKSGIEGLNGTSRAARWPAGSAVRPDVT